MNLIGQIVSHKAFGIGVITAFRNSYITVSFACGKKDFVYPNAFGLYLSFKDEKLQQTALNEIVASKRQASSASNDRGFLHTADIQNDDYRQTTSLSNTYTASKRQHRQRSGDLSNLAFKCTYCDGGKNNSQIGFHGACSPELIHYNIKKSSRNRCHHSAPYCPAFIKGEITYDEVKEAWTQERLPCESILLKEWRMQTGLASIYDKEKRPSQLRCSVAGKLAILTTRRPDQTEIERQIFAVFLIDETMDQYDDYSYIHADSLYRLSLSAHEAQQMPYWKYHCNENQTNKASWGTGIYRYLSDDESLRILWDITQMKLKSDDAGLAAEFFDYYCDINNLSSDEIPEAKGALTL